MSNIYFALNKLSPHSSRYSSSFQKPVGKKKKTYRMCVGNLCNLPLNYAVNLKLLLENKVLLKKIQKLYDFCFST